VGRIFAHGKGESTRFPAAAGTAGTLKIVCRMGRNVIHAHYGNAANVDAHFHSSGTREHIDVPLPKSLSASIKLSRCKLCGMLLNPKVWGELHDPIVRAKPKSGLSEQLNFFVFRKPYAGFLNAFFGCRAKRRGIEWYIIFLAWRKLLALQRNVGRNAKE